MLSSTFPQSVLIVILVIFVKMCKLFSPKVEGVDLQRNQEKRLEFEHFLVYFRTVAEISRRSSVLIIKNPHFVINIKSCYCFTCIISNLKGNL